MGKFVNHFRGTARFYAASRPAYPEEVWDLLAREARLGPSSVVLDLGCGPGTAALSLARRVGSVTAVDPDVDMLAEGRKAASSAGIANVRWVQATAEGFDDEPGRYQLIVIASAFHWMDRAVVAKKCHDLLVPGGLLAVLGNGEPARPEQVIRDSPFGAVRRVEPSGRWGIRSNVEVITARRRHGSNRP